jgi:hypothetical protein
MAYRYQIDPSNTIAIISASSKVTFDEMMKNTINMLQDSDWKPGYKLLVDYREVDDISLKTRDLKDFFIRIKKYRSRLSDTKIAIISHKNCAFCLTRLWESLSEKRLNVTSKIFKRYNEAEKWLGYKASEIAETTV